MIPSIIPFLMTSINNQPAAVPAQGPRHKLYWRLTHENAEHDRHPKRY